jgi:hypothetical protein
MINIPLTSDRHLPNRRDEIKPDVLYERFVPVAKARLPTNRFERP